MPPALKALTPMVHVADVSRSIKFYEQLGFELGNTFTPDGSKEATWAWLVSGGAQIMVTKAGEPVDARAQAVIFYLYCADVEAMHSHLKALGHDVREIATPFYAPRGEFRVKDPDGYDIMITHT
jgi:predicted enzyme related to lactoylglutathione lyase